MSYRNARSAVQNITTEADTSFTKEEFGTTLKLLDGTQITYTPSASASKVIYECQFTTAWNPDTAHSLPCIRLQYSTDSGGSWSTLDGTKTFLGNKSAISDYNWHCFFVAFCIPAWTGARMLRLYGRAYDSGSEWILGRSYRIPSSEGLGACPIVKCYSIE